MNKPRPFADAVVAYAQVQCKFFPNERCVACGPDRERWLDDGCPRTAAPPPAPVLDSPIEVLFWEAHKRLQLPALADLVAQYPIDAGGHRFRLDFALVARKIAFELDGYRWHANRIAWAKDRRRDLSLAVIGWRTYRFDGSLVKRDPEFVVRTAAEIVRNAA